MIIMHNAKTASRRLLLVSIIVSPMVYSEPQITSVDGDITTGQMITIKGSGFTNKPNPAPLFWWRADDGISPSSLGRTSDWVGGKFEGELSTAFTAPGSSQSIAWDHGLSSLQALGRVDFDSNELFMHRKYYEDFDVVENVGIRTWVNITDGTVNVGDTITGVSTGAIGIVAQVFHGTNKTTVYYHRAGGTLDDNPPVYFLKDEILTGPSGTMINIEPFSPDGSSDPGTFISFNHKMIRLWNYDGGATTSLYLVAQGAESNKLRFTPEGTDSTIWNGQFINPLTQAPYKWNIDEVVYRASSEPDVADAQFKYSLNGLLASDKTFISRTSSKPGLYHAVFQSQVSNGAQPGSIIYYDSLYIDDSWHRVVICKEGSWKNCIQSEIQIPTSWSDSEITVQYNAGGIDNSYAQYLYVFDQNGVANPNGYPLCPKCPLPPSLQ